MNLYKFGEANHKKFLLPGLVLALILPIFFVLAIDEVLIPICESMEKIEAECKNLSQVECRRLLENCEKYYDEKSAQIEENISKTEREKKTLQNQIYILKEKIKKLDLQIQQSNILIRDISLQIKDTEASIEKTSEKIEEKKRHLVEILRTISEMDKKSLLEILISEESLSGFFDNLTYLETLNAKSQELLEVVKDLKTSLEDQKMVLDKEKENLENVQKMQILQKQESEKTKKEKEQLSKLTEAQYQKLLTEKKEIEKKAADIRARIFELIGVPQAPTFGEAYELAKWVENITGVRPAFLLAVLTQESNIGKNVGQCYLKDPQTGEGIRITTGEKVKNVMKPSRDVQPFLEITKELGRDPYNTPVSCPIPSIGGWGGAMGPAQFIPSTWIKYKERISQITGKTPDPWNIKDSFLAAALYLADYGATKKTYDAEWKAAIIYFSGSTSTRYRFYGDSVMAIAKGYEEDIKTLEAGLTQRFFESPNDNI
jgi:membrane-bound lytic murein transglycosylase B